MQPFKGQLRMGPSKEQQKQGLSRKRKWIEFQWDLCGAREVVADPRVAGGFVVE